MKMNRRSLLMAGGYAWCLSYPDLVAAAQQPSSRGEVLARYPNGHYLENLTVARDGRVFYTDYFEKAVEVWSPGGSRTFARLPHHAVNLVENDVGFLVLTHEGRFTEGPEALRDRNHLVQIDRQGQVRQVTRLPGVVFGNGVVPLQGGKLLMTDSILGRIWHVDVSKGETRSWFEDERLRPATGGRAPGANGLRRRDDTLYVSNSSTRGLYTLGIAAGDIPRTVLTPVQAELEGIDDFAIASDGTLYIATHQTRLQVLRTNGSVQTLLDRDVDGCTSAALASDGKTLYVLGTGGLYEGKKEDATLVRTTL